MECKGSTEAGFERSCFSIDLTRMECKAGAMWGMHRTEVGIDLTRMECKGNYHVWCNQGAFLYRFNQNGM